MTDETEKPGNGMTKRDIEKAAAPIVMSTLALQRERDAAIEAYNELFERTKQLEIDLAAEHQKSTAAMDMLRLTEERRALMDAEYRNQLTTYVADRLAEKQVHADEMIRLKLDLAHVHEQIDRIITACLNVLKEKGDAPQVEPTTDAGPQ